MKTQPIVPAHLVFGDDGAAQTQDFGDGLLAPDAALAQARAVHLAGNELPARWAGRDGFVVLATGFGLGHAFLAFWDAWQRDPQRCRQLVFVAIERHPPRRDDLARGHRGSALPQLVQALLAAWPPLTPNLHAIDFEGGRVRLLLALGDVAAVLPELTLQADAFCLHGLAPAQQAAPWRDRVIQAIGRRAVPGATLTSASVAEDLQAHLLTAGFHVDPRPGGGSRAFTQARHRPRHAAPAAAPPRRCEAVVVGAGLGGAAVARALVDEGWQVSVLDRHATPAFEASGNAGGLFHGTVHADDGPHARLLRAAALHAERTLRPWIEQGRVPGQLQGLLRLDARPLAEMQALITRHGLPADWVQTLDPPAASASAGVLLASAAWLYPGGGWVAPAALVAHWLQGLRFVGNSHVQTLQPLGEGWRLRDGNGAVLAEAPVVVLANADDAARLLGADWPLQRLRGQVSSWSGEPTPLRRPLAGDGYALPLPGGGLLCGASSDDNDTDSTLRTADHLQNFERLLRLTGMRPPQEASRWSGRVGWRVAAEDRLPIVGPVPAEPTGPRRDQARLWPRVPGLFVCTALGGRGITLAPLLGRLVAAQVAGTPLPLEQSLVDAIDPVRWQVRAVRRGRA